MESEIADNGEIAAQLAKVVAPQAVIIPAGDGGCSEAQ
jgi:hypothetical protein